MGQDICAKVYIYQQYFCHTENAVVLSPFDDLDPKIAGEVNTGRKENVSEQDNGNSSGQKSQEQKIQEPIQIDILKCLEELRDMFKQGDPKEIFLNIDKTWEDQIRLMDKEKDIRHYYTKLRANQYKRTGEDGFRYQILFRQHIPIFGKFFFEVELEEWPDRDCQFTIGVLDYLKGVQTFRSRNSKYAEWFDFNVRQAVSQQEKLRRCNKILRLEIDRERSNLTFCIFQVGKEGIKELKRQEKQSKLLKEAEQSIDMISLAPFIQSRYAGFVFSWKRMPMQRSSGYKMSTIIQEESSIRATS